MSYSSMTCMSIESSPSPDNPLCEYCGSPTLRIKSYHSYSDEYTVSYRCTDDECWIENDILAS